MQSSVQPSLPPDILTPLPPSAFSPNQAASSPYSDGLIHDDDTDDDLVMDEDEDSSFRADTNHSAYQQSPRSTRFESMADSPIHSYGTSAMRELLDLQRQKSTILKRISTMHDSHVVPSQQFWSVAADVCENVNIIQSALKPTIEMYSIEDEALHTSSLDILGFFKEIETIIELGKREFNANRISSQWSDAQSSPPKNVDGRHRLLPPSWLVGESYASGTGHAGVVTLRLLDRIFQLRQRIACHDALLTLHRHMWMARDEQWEGFSREAESFWIRKSKVREAELVDRKSVV